VHKAAQQLQICVEKDRQMQHRNQGGRRVKNQGGLRVKKSGRPAGSMR
jgi:hypothetical protein